MAWRALRASRLPRSSTFDSSAEIDAYHNSFVDNCSSPDEGAMSAPIPHPSKPRKPGLPMPKLAIPPRQGTPVNSSNVNTPGSSSDEPLTASSSTSESVSSSSTGGRPHGKPAPPKLSLSTKNQSYDSAPLLAAGLEDLSLDEHEKTLRPGIITHQSAPTTHPHPPLHISTTAQKYYGGGGPAPTRPKLALNPSASSSASSLRLQTPPLHPSLSSIANDSDSMIRSNSFEGALTAAEPSSIHLGGDDYKLLPSAFEDLGRLGEGASGEVRKVLHKPSGIVVAKKVCV